MKKLLLFLVVVALVGCAQPDIIKKYYVNGGSVKKFVDTQVFPVLLTKSGLNYNAVELGRTPANDHANGIFYKENAKSYDNKTHEIDLGYLTGGNQALVYLVVKVVDHGYDYYRDKYDDSTGPVYIRGKGSKEQWNSVTPSYGKLDAGVLVLTNEKGVIEWYHDYQWNYLDNPLAKEQYYIYKWEKVVVNAVWLVEGLTIDK